METDRKAVAMEYTGEIPRILAKARGRLAETLIGIARDHGITVVNDPDLAEVLSAMKPGFEIPEDLFLAVAEVLAYCYRINENFKKKLDAKGNL